VSSTARRYLLIVVLLLLAAGVAWGQRLFPASFVEPASLGGDGEGSASAAQYTYFVDVEGWYRITPYEAAVRSPYDLTADSSEEMAKALPAALSEWEQVGVDGYIAEDPTVVRYLRHPTVALQRSYRDPVGQNLALVLIGNVGDDSFLLFSHTPDICYPSSDWEILEDRRDSALLDDRPMYAHYLFAGHVGTGARLVVLYWYLWDNPGRDSRDGVLSMRVNLYLLAGQGEEEALARAWDFVRLLFPATAAWERF